MRQKRLVRSSFFATVFVLPILVAALGVQPTPGAQTARGAIKGVVKDPAGSPVAGARVTLRSTATSRAASASTKSDGSYAFASLAAGRYTVEVERAAFERASRADIIVGSDTQTVNLVLARMADQGVADYRAEHQQGRSADSKLGDFKYYDEARLKAAEPVDPSVGGGYSDSAGPARRDLVRDYIAGRDTAASNALPGDSPPDEEAIERSASELLRRQAYAQAVEVLSQGLVRFPQSERLELGLGTALYARGQYNDALRDFLKATDFAPSDPQPYVFLAKAYLAGGAQIGAQAGVQPAEVLKRLKHLSEIEPSSAQAHYYYAVVLAKAAPADDLQLQEVLAELERAIVLDPNYAEARLELGILNARQSKYRDAIEQFREVIRLKPEMAEAHYRLGQSYAHSGDKASAQAEFDTYQKLRQKADSADGRQK